MPDAHRWRGRVFFGAELMLYAGAIAPTTTHAHPTMQIALAPGADLALGDDRGRAVHGSAFVVPARARHAIVVHCPRVVVLHVALERASTRGLRALDIDPDDPRAWRAAGEKLALPRPVLPRTWSEAERFAKEVLGHLAPHAVQPRPTHPAVRHALGCLPGMLEERVRLSELARAAGVSASRLSHLFTAEVGTSFRAYAAWLRLQRAAERLAVGDSITRAAHAAGFVDGAHLSHAFKRTFGLSPRGLAADTEWFVDGAASGYKHAVASRRRLPRR